MKTQCELRRKYTVLKQREFRENEAPPPPGMADLTRKKLAELAYQLGNEEAARLDEEFEKDKEDPKKRRQWMLGNLM